ncbi:MAG: TIGR02647 family protein [Gammaproteobacteria bacterium]|nr:TIGR02647 family protein [Gammaproteobacteria bacterium]
MSKPPLFTPELAAEMEVLSRFDLRSLHTGLKIHKDAPPSVASAAIRLHTKGLISAEDGGFLTDLGVEVAEHLEHVLIALRGAVH